MKIKRREKSPIVCPVWQVTRSSPTTNRKGELRNKNNTINKIINIKPHPIYLSRFLVYWLLYNITPQSHNLYEKDLFTTLVLRDLSCSHEPTRSWSNSTDLPARSPTLQICPLVVQHAWTPTMNLPAHSSLKCEHGTYEPPRSYPHTRVQ